MKMIRRVFGIALLFGGCASGLLAQADTGTQAQKVEAPRAAVEPVVLDDAQLARETAGASTINYSTLKRDQPAGKTTMQPANTASRGCSAANQCRS